MSELADKIDRLHASCMWATSAILLAIAIGTLIAVSYRGSSEARAETNLRATVPAPIDRTSCIAFVPRDSLVGGW